MNAHTPRVLTEAETTLVGAFNGKTDWPGSDKVQAIRASAINAIQDLGLPTRRVEAFHYTDLRALMGNGFAPSERPSTDDAHQRASNYKRLTSAIRLPIMNGHYFADLADDLPDSVRVLPSFQAGGFGEPDTYNSNAVELINTAFVTDGVAITVDAGAVLSAPIGLAHTFAEGQGSMAVSRHSIEIGAGARVDIVDRHAGPDGLSYLSSSIVDLTVDEGATVNYTLAIEEGDTAQRLARLRVTLAKNAKLNLFVLNAGGKLVRQELDFVMNGEGADLVIAGANLIGGEAHIDVTSRISHFAPSTTANEIFRNVATGKGRGVFQGQINVAQPAQLTDARMACNTLLLSDDCDFSAKPELEIFADDVQCAHGATVADLEDSYLFYLRARGISEVTARRMLVKAFVAEVLEELESEDLAAALDMRIDAWMARHV